MLVMLLWAPVTNADTPITSQMNGKCVDVPWGNIAVGTELAIYDCNNRQNQQFAFLPSGEIKVGGLCVDAYGGHGNNGDHVGLWSCHGGPNQKWRLENGSIIGMNNRCLDIAGGSRDNGAKLLLWDCHGGLNQKWNITSRVTITDPQPPSPAACNPQELWQKLTGQNGTERCFGGIGSHCQDQVAGVLKLRFFGATVNSDCTIKVAVSVGGIMHDNCCRQNQNGLHCRGLQFGQDVNNWLTDPGDQQVCGLEWRKAVNDVFEGRAWYETFGPYRSDADYDIADQLVNPRKAYVRGRFGVNDNPRVWRGMESQATSRLAAPAGTKLEAGDDAFCRSGILRDERWKSWLDNYQEHSKAELDAARADLHSWETWRDRKIKERDQYWPVDPRNQAINAELLAAEPDHAGKISRIIYLENLFNNRVQHWGYCQ